MVKCGLPLVSKASLDGTLILVGLTALSGVSLPPPVTHVVAPWPSRFTKCQSEDIIPLWYYTIPFKTLTNSLETPVAILETSIVSPRTLHLP